MIKSVIKEIGIILLLFVVIVLITAFVFYDYNPINKTIPSKVDAYVLPEEVEQEIGMLHEYMLSDIAMTLGGREAESIVFGERLLSAGCYGDLQEATSLLNILKTMVLREYFI